MNAVKVILTETIDALGIIGSEVKVKPGYARNYLLPQGKALKATDVNRRSLAAAKAKYELKIAKEREIAEQMAKRLEGVAVRISAKVSEEERLYGSVGVRDIMEGLEKLGIEVERKMVLLSEPIKSLGTYEVPIRVYAGVEPEITVEVVSEE